jgi:sugar phosphate isomerase/epimerase
MHSRRTFLTTMTVAAGLPFVTRGTRAFAAAKVLPVGLELYTVRDALGKDLMGTVRAVAKMGYQVVEFYSPYYSWTPQQAADVRKLLDDLGITCRSTHNSDTAFMPDGLQKAIDLNKTIGSRYLIMASPGRITGADSWKAVADRLNAASETLKPLGMSAGYHNHAAEWHPIETGGPAGSQRPMDILATNTLKDVALQFDVGTCLESNADPVAWINENPGRIKSIHCKDWSPAKGYHALFAEGDAPWAKIFAAAEGTGGVEYYLVEQEEGPADEQLTRAERCLANWKKLRSASASA